MTLDFILIFLGVAFLDAIWVLYTKFTQEDKEIKASVIAAILWLVSSTVFIEIVNDPRLLIAGSLGGFVGTYATLKLKRIYETWKGF